MPFVRSVFDVPNITGSLATRPIETTSSFGVVGDGKGAFETTRKTGTNIMSWVQIEAEGSKSDSVSFDASRSSSSFVNNGVIRPQSISVLVLLRL